jgi:biopolymer transport protein TolR
MGMSGGVGDDGPVANINVTPLVDVMLVMLVIFMVTAPMLQQGVDVNLPKVSAGGMTGSQEQIVVSIDKEGKVFLGSENEVEISELADKIKAVMEAKKSEGEKVYVKADQDIDYGSVMKVMGALYAGGINQIGLVTAAPDNQDSVKQDSVKEDSKSKGAKK